MKDGVTLNLMPKVYYLGIGCRRNTTMENIENLVLQSLDALKIDIKTIAGIASVDLKQDEEGLLAFAEKFSLPISFYTAAELENQQGEFSSSAFLTNWDFLGVNFPPILNIEVLTHSSGFPPLSFIY